MGAIIVTTAPTGKNQFSDSIYSGTAGSEGRDIIPTTPNSTCTAKKKRFIIISIA
jgi:hypothetical protein